MTKDLKNYYQDFHRKISEMPAINTFLVMFIFLPLFFQLTLNIYSDSSTLIKSVGGISRLPIPFSVPACFFGLLFYGAFRKASLSWILIISSCFLMVFTSIVVSEKFVSVTKWKLMLFQYLLPMFAFILGYIIETREQKTAIAEMGILCSIGLIVPLQLLSTWVRRSHFEHPFSNYSSIVKYLVDRSGALYDHVFFFSIYQHLQYVPCILISAYVFALFGLWSNKNARLIFLSLTPVVGVYTIASTSKLALGCYLIGVFLFVFYFCRKQHFVLPILLLILSISAPTVYLLLGRANDKGDNILNEKFSFLTLRSDTSPNTKKLAPASRVPAVINGDHLNENNESIENKSVSGRLRFWRFYVRRITDSAQSFFFGHPEQPDINKIPSAHNYWLDFIYNFGFLALIPLLMAAGGTIILIILNFKTITTSPSLFGLTFSVLFLLFADNSLKVGMRQLYPGIASFFLWGLLSNRLISTVQNNK